MAMRIIVTGAGGILGGVVAGHLARLGHEVIGLDLAVGSGGFPGDFFGSVDLTCEQSTTDAVAKVGGPVHGLACIAGGFVWETVSEGSIDSWTRMHAMNVTTALVACRAVLPLMPNGGSIVNIGAAATVRAGAGMGAYTASKSGVARLTEALAEEHKGVIRVNAVLPSIIDTPANRADMGEADAGKWVTPLELAKVIAFLLSDEASAITGALIPVTGRV
jgi:NAD(P)-dependent dehydrogenase (short-subunit alcohol dehydrogenase family)